MEIQPWLSSSLDLVRTAFSFALALAFVSASAASLWFKGKYVHSEGGRDSVSVLILLFELDREFMRFFPCDGLSHNFLPRCGS